MVAKVSGQELIGRGATVYGQTVQIFRVDYSEDMPGMGNQSFAVSVSGREGVPPHTAGFKSVEEVKKYLHSTGTETFVGYTKDGAEVEEQRECLGIPRGMVSTLPSK